MPVRRSGYYSDPNIAKAFDNLAGAFAPPSGTDVAGFARARAEKEKADRLSEIFNYAKNPNFNRQQADQLGVMGGLFNPNQSYYSVDQGNRTTLQTNQADNARALQQTEMQQRGDTDRKMLDPVAQGATRFVPPALAEKYGVPGTQIGNIELKPGEQTVTPDGRTLNGPPVPLTMDQWTAQQAAQLRGNGSGMLNDQMVVSKIMGTTPTEVVQGENGPTNVWRSDSIGKAPVMTPDKVQVANYKTADGRVGTAKMGIYGSWVDTQTNETLPPGTQTYTANLTGDQKSTGLGPTTANNTASNSRAAEVTRTLDTLDLYEGLVRNKPGVVGIPGLIRGTTQNVVAVANDVAKSFGKTVPQIEAITSELRDGMKGVAPDFFEPAIPETQFYQGTLAYALARTENPSGEVSRQAFERAYERVKGGVLSNPDQILATIGAFRKSLQTELGAVGALRNPSAARTDTGYRGDPQAAAATTIAPAGATGSEAPKVEKWIRGPNGQLQRAQ